MVTAPIDLLKIRFQLDTTAHPMTGSTINGILDEGKRIYRQEGIRAFWKGNTAGIWLYASFSGIQFWTFNQLKDQLNTGIAGGASAMLATLVTYPFDVLRTRMALQASHPEIYGSFSRTIGHILKHEGASGFYKGIGPTLGQVIPYMGLTFYLQNKTKRAMRSLGDLTRITDSKKAVIDFIAGAVAGATSKTIMMPVDVIRKRLQVCTILF
jgi:solute carrier family 25 thiamine pyrophosphate transporter 19